jgi:hypothetical protein
MAVEKVAVIMARRVRAEVVRFDVFTRTPLSAFVHASQGAAGRSEAAEHDRSVGKRFGAFLLLAVASASRVRPDRHICGVIQKPAEAAH